MPNEELITYVRSEIAKGISREAIIQSLSATGWKVEDVHAALTFASVAYSPSSAPKPTMFASVSSQTYEAPVATSSKSSILDGAASFFITCVAVLTLISLMGVWDVFSTDVVGKSFETLGLLAFAALIITAAGNHVGAPEEAAVPNPVFRTVRNITLVVLIISTVILTILGVFVIWEIIKNSDVLSKSLSSLAIIAFASLVIVLVCQSRDQAPRSKKK